MKFVALQGLVRIFTQGMQCFLLEEGSSPLYSFNLFCHWPRDKLELTPFPFPPVCVTVSSNSSALTFLQSSFLSIFYGCAVCGRGLSPTYLSGSRTMDFPFHEPPLTHLQTASSEMLLQNRSCFMSTRSTDKTWFVHHKRNHNLSYLVSNHGYWIPFVFIIIVLRNIS